MKQSRVQEALAALANETRLDLVRLLMPCGAQGMAQGEIARHLDISASRLAFHLTQLEQAGLVAARRESRNVFYAAIAPEIGRVLGFVLHDCCAADPQVSACCQKRP